MKAVPTAPSNGIELAYETFGDRADPSILLIMGLGAQMTGWDEGFCALLVARGYHVIRFDNRDVGGSTWIDTSGLDVGAAALRLLQAQPVTVPYTLSDLSDDAVGLLDHLGIDGAHVVGASMGGMVAQTMAIERPYRVRSLTSIMSATNPSFASQVSPELVGLLLRPRPADPVAGIEQGVAVLRAISSPDHFDEDRARARVTRDAERGVNPAGVGRQLLAILASGSREDGLVKLDLPALVVHGRQDPLVSFSGGQRTAELVAGADFLAIDDMAHDLPQAHWLRIADAIAAVTHRT